MKIKIASLKSEPTCKKNIIPGLHLLILSLPGLASRTHVESLAKPWGFSKLLKLISKDTHLVFSIYQLPLILTALLYVDLINIAYLTGCVYQVIMTLHFLNDVVSDVESNTKIGNYVIIATLKSEPTFKLINRIPETCSTMRALGVLSSAFSLKASACQGACKCSRFKSIGVSPENQRLLPK